MPIVLDVTYVVCVENMSQEDKQDFDRLLFSEVDESSTVSSKSEKLAFIAGFGG